MELILLSFYSVLHHARYRIHEMVHIPAEPFTVQLYDDLLFHRLFHFSDVITIFDQLDVLGS